MGHALLHSPARHAARGDGRVLGRTRAGIWVLLVLAAANALFLYLLPGRADSDYAWSIELPVNAAFIGAGFLAGTLATGLVLATATRWRTFSTLPPALWVLASTVPAVRDRRRATRRRRRRALRRAGRTRSGLGVATDATARAHRGRVVRAVR